MEIPPRTTTSRNMRHAEKAEEIEQLLAAQTIELWRIRELAITEGGLVNDEIRKLAWPKIVGLRDEWEQPSSSATERTCRQVDVSCVSSPSTSNFQHQQHQHFFSDHHQRDLYPGRLSPRSVAHATTPDSPPRRFNSSSDPVLKQKQQQHVPSQVTVAASESAVASPLAPPTSHQYTIDLQHIERDVCRCTFHLLSGSHHSQEILLYHKRDEKVSRQIRLKQRRLANLINLTLLKAPEAAKFRYYQGFHDIASIFLSTLAAPCDGGASLKCPKDSPAASSSRRQRPPRSPVSPGSSVVQPSSPSPSPEITTPTSASATKGLVLPASVLLRVSQSHLRDALKPSFVDLQTCLRLTLFPLLARIDPELEAHLQDCGHMDSNFALSWVLTWFSHDIQDTRLVKRLFDVFLVSHPLLPIYLSVAMVSDPGRVNRQLLLDTECEFTSLYQVLKSLPQNSVPTSSILRLGTRRSATTIGRGDDEEDDLHPDEDDNLVHSEPEINGDLLASSLDRQLPEDETKKCDDRHNDLDTTSVSDTSSCCSTFDDSESSATIPLVPFQSLIDSAIRIMDKVPPADLVTLARRYHGNEAVDQMLREASPAVMLDRPAPWAIASHTDHSLEATATSSKNVDAFLRQNVDRVAVIAAGFGLGDVARRRRRVIFKRRIRRAALLLLICSITTMLVVLLLPKSLQAGDLSTTTRTEL